MRTFLVSLIVGLCVGGWLGYRLSDGRCTGDKLAVAEARIEAADTASEIARIHAKAESQRRTAQAVRDARRASASRAARLNGQSDARKEPVRAECDWPAVRLHNLNAAIDAANAADAAPERVPDGLPDAATADGQR